MLCTYDLVNLGGEEMGWSKFLCRMILLMLVVMPLRLNSSASRASPSASQLVCVCGGGGGGGKGKELPKPGTISNWTATCSTSALHNSVIMSVLIGHHYSLQVYIFLAFHNQSRVRREVCEKLNFPQMTQFLPPKIDNERLHE
jgi:hypothetical protein